MGHFPCLSCSKVYRTSGGLARHEEKKHTSTLILTAKPFDKEVLKQLVLETAENLSVDLCYPIEVRSLFLNYQYPTTSDLLFKRD